MLVREQFVFAVIGVVMLVASLAWSDPHWAAVIKHQAGLGLAANQSCANMTMSRDPG
jgi:hypothetical protein